MNKPNEYLNILYLVSKFLTEHGEVRKEVFDDYFLLKECYDKIKEDPADYACYITVSYINDMAESCDYMTSLKDRPILYALLKVLDEIRIEG